MSQLPAAPLKPPVEGASTFFFSPEAAAACAADIAEADGVEVFFIGRRNETGLVAEVESHAYGSTNAVPALLDLARPGEVFIHNHPNDYLMPSEADLSIATTVGNMGVGFYIINNRCDQCRVVVRPRDARKRVHIRVEDVENALVAGSRLSRVIGEYEDRPQQRDMAALVTDAFNHDGIAVVEAGTGTGKSFAYLIPSILYAIKNDERVVVSTNTINLQEQLLNKDIPALRQALNEEILVELVKGRGNYVCKRKAQYAREEGGSFLDDDFQRELLDVLAWAAESPTGDRQDLTIIPRGEVWERVQSEADNCLRVRCPFYEECFFYNSRRRAARARVLIVNHSLLMSDLAVRRATGNYTSAAVLPPYSRVILDEAHNIEETATKNLAQQITRPGLRQVLAHLYRKDSSGGRGVLSNLTEHLEQLVRDGKLDGNSEVIQQLYFDLMPRVADIRDNLDFLFDDFSRRFLEIIGKSSIQPREEHKVRITSEISRHATWRNECHELLSTMAAEISAFLDKNRNLYEAFCNLEEETVEALINPLTEWVAYIGRLDGLRRTVLAILRDDPAQCRWVELAMRATGNRDLIVRLCLAPVDVRQVLKESLHDRMKSEVLTSATLTVDRDFRFFQERAGLPVDGEKPPPPELDEDGMPVRQIDPVEARHFTATQLSTPFDYERQVFFGVPTDLPDPRDNGFADAFADFVNRAVTISGGRAFILFTSYGLLRMVADRCEPYIRRLGIDVLRQGTKGRDALLNQFREDETSVLFATSSFWEGVDVKGRSLELLIIARLPFAVPTEPIQEAQFEALRAQGRDPFATLVVPRAVIRFKQGFGRLIRSRTDRGAVLIADKRVINMPYGRRFLHSLPEIDVRRDNAQSLLSSVSTFFHKSSQASADAAL